MTCLQRLAFKAIVISSHIFFTLQAALSKNTYSFIPDLAFQETHSASFFQVEQAKPRKPTSTTPYLLGTTATMKKITKAVVCVVAGAALMLPSKPVSAQGLVLNGGFENFDLSEGRRHNKTDWNYFDAQYLDSNKSTLGWQTTNGGTLEVRQDGVSGQAHSGSGYFAELDSHNYAMTLGSNQDLGIFQDIATKVGKKYRFEFSYAARPNIDGDRNQFEALFGNDFVQQFDGGNGKTTGGKTWKTFSQDVIASSETSRLQFNYLGTRDTLGAHIDSVSVQAVPEPASLLGLGFIGLFGIGSVAKRKSLAAE